MEVYLMPIGSPSAVEHMNNTLLNDIEKARIIPFISSSEEIPEYVFENDKTSIWGLTPGKQNVSKWQQFSRDDIIIFVPTQYDLLVAKITHKLRNKHLAENLWGLDQNNQTWELIFFVKIIAVLGIPKRELLTELGYDPADNLMGSRRVTKNFLHKYGSIESFVSSNQEEKIDVEIFAQDTAEKIIASTMSKKISHTDKLALLDAKIKEIAPSAAPEYVEINGRKIRRRQLFVAFVKERDNYKCRACGFTFTKTDGTQYVEAAHVVGLGKKGPDDPSNMVALCANCHKKLDKGNKETRNEVLGALGLSI